MKFSIITVVYNDFTYLEQTIESVIKQPGIDLEYIIIDGGSDDGTIEIIKKYEKYLSYWVSERDNGIYDAMNKGLQHVTGDVVAFLNSGDWYEDGALKIVEECFNDTLAKIVYGRVRRKRNEIDDGFIGISVPCNQELLHIENLYCHQGLFIRKEVFDDVGSFDCNYKIYADFDWNLRAHNKGYSFHFILAVVANFRWGGLSTVHSSPVEKHEVCLKNLDGHEEYRNEINEQFIVKKKEKAISILAEDNSENMCQILSDECMYYIWGMGDYGTECYKLMKKKKFHVEALIDSNKEKVNKSKIKAYTADNFMDSVDRILHEEPKSMLIVTPRVYDSEIRKELIGKKPELENRIILYSYIQEWAYKKYRDTIESF